MYHHYLQKGITPQHIDNLSYLSRQFYAASMDIELSERVELESLRSKMLKEGRAQLTVPL
ncbi:MAG: hypothetical protein ABS942_11135 [Solibacillus sp.]